MIVYSSPIVHSSVITKFISFHLNYESIIPQKYILVLFSSSGGTGSGLSKAFENKWAFPRIAYEMLLTGEKTGRLGPMMENVALYYEEELNVFMDNYEFTRMKLDLYLIAE